LLSSANFITALKNNVGNIVTAINADTTGITLKGKHITLDGDTVLTGTFKVGKANIANAAIGTAQIGDAAITSAKIANLDVSKITGNVTNFIQSNWSGQYESTTITAAGMQIGSVLEDGYSTHFDSSGIHFYQITDNNLANLTDLHFGKSQLLTSEGVTIANGAEINWGAKDGKGLDYMLFMAPGANNLEFGSSTSANHIAMAIAPKGISIGPIPVLNDGVTIFDGLTVVGDASVGNLEVSGKLNGASTDFFDALKGKKIMIPTSIGSDGKVSQYYTIQM
jgi:hypothetical protein